MLTLEHSQKLGNLFNKLADAWKLLSDEEKALLRDVMPICEPIGTSFFEDLDTGYCFSGTLNLYTMMGMKEFEEGRWLEFCEADGLDPNAH